MSVDNTSSIAKRDESQIIDERLSLEDIDNLRKPCELPHHWQLRKEFLKLHSDKFEVDRLVCLSNCFINIEILGVTYHDEVMKLVKELGSQVKGLETFKFQIEEEEQVEPEPKRKVPSSSSTTTTSTSSSWNRNTGGYGNNRSWNNNNRSGGGNYRGANNHNNNNNNYNRSRY